jgi:integrase
METGGRGSTKSPSSSVQGCFALPLASCREDSIRDIKPLELLAVMQRIEQRGRNVTAHRALQNCGRVFRYAVATGRAERDITRDLIGALAPVVERHHASIVEPKAVGALLRAIDSYEGSFITRCALRLAPLVFVRPANYGSPNGPNSTLLRANGVFRQLA